MQEEESQRHLTFNGLLLLGVTLVMGATAGTCATLYLVPPPVLELPELQPFTRVAGESEFPVGASRIVNRGEDIILIVRQSETVFAGLQAVSPADGCVLEWDEDALRIVSPCTYVVHDLEGNVVEGLTTTPLRKYGVYVRGGTIWVTT
jgi:nitrite reductase/ring-hydroxylating ferredoxin subunit